MIRLIDVNTILNNAPRQRQLGTWAFTLLLKAFV